MKINKLILTVLMFLLLAVFATALQVESATIGDKNQDRVANITTTFKITNNGNATLDNITVSTNADAKYNIQFTNAPTTLAPGASQTVTVTGDIPIDFDAVDKQTLEEKAFKIGEITVEGYDNSGGPNVTSILVTETSELSMQAVNQLKIRKVKVTCGTNEEKLDDEEKMRNLKPDSKCSLYLKVENDFPDKDKNNQKIGDIEIDTTVEVESDNSDVDLDDYEDFSGFYANDYEEVTFDFDIDEETNDGTYTVTIKLYGTDENGAEHGKKWTVYLEVKRLKHDVQIKKVNIMPSEVETCDDSLAIAATVYNMGRRDEKEAAIELSIPEFKFSKKIENIDLDTDDQTVLSFDITLPENLKEGIYKGTLKSFFDTIAESNVETVQIKVVKCSVAEEVEETKEKEQTTTVIVPQQQQQIPPKATQAQTPPKATKKDSFTESTAYLGLLTALVVLLLLTIVIIGVVFFVKKK